MKKHYNSILSLLEKCKTMAELKQLHGLMITTSVVKDVIPLSRLVDFCANSESGNLIYAKSVFERINWPSLYIWNSMIKGYSNSESPDEALNMYREMQQKGFAPDHFTFPFVLKACSLVNGYNSGQCVHNCIVKTGFEVNVYAAAALLQMYAASGDMGAALKVFDDIPKWNVVAWTSLIAGYISNGRPSEAVMVYKDMELSNVVPNEITMVNVLVACAKCRDIHAGRWVHDRICQMGLDPFSLNLDFNVILATAIVDMYAKCGWLKTARNLFNKMPHRNLLAWNSIIRAYNQCGQANEALGLFSDMRAAGFEPDKATFLCLIGACAHLGALVLGQALHAYVSKRSLNEDTAIGTALLDMYAKSGDAERAQQIFSELQNKDLMAWTSLIVGLAMHGHGEKALTFFRKMQEETMLIPDEITYIGLLSACSHIGKVEDGKNYFISMKNVHGIEPTTQHYGCMVDLLSRAGRLREAERLVEKMPVEPNTAIWSALLNGCKIYQNVDVAERVRRRVRELGVDGSGVYVLLSNIYAGACRWEDAKMARQLMKERRIQKSLGHSSVEMKMLAP